MGVRLSHIHNLFHNSLWSSSMQSGGGAAQRCSQVVRRYTTATWLPFLYQTRTIQGQRFLSRSSQTSDRDPGDDWGTTHEGSQTSGRPVPRSSAHDSRSDIFSRNAESDQTRSPHKSRSNGGAGYKERRNGSRHGYRAQDHRSRELGGRVPFEGLQKVSRGAAEDAMVKLKAQSTREDSTLTTSEYRAFQSLLSLQKPPTTAQTVEEREPDGQMLNSALEEALGVKMLPLEQAQELGLANDMLDVSPDTPGEGELNRVMALMRDARSDARVWHILQNEVFAPLRALGLGGETQPQEEYNETAATPKAESSDKMSKQQLMMQSLAQHLITFQKVLEARFPSSLHSLAILPYLKRQGSAMFTLGASTQLYNVHLRQLFRKHYDVASMTQILQEMNDQVYEFDGETLEIVSSVLDDADEALGPRRSGKTLLWDTEQMRELRLQMRDWREQIESQITERALHEARMREEQGLQHGQQDLGPLMSMEESH